MKNKIYLFIVLLILPISILFSLNNGNTWILILTDLADKKGFVVGKAGELLIINSSKRIPKTGKRFSLILPCKLMVRPVLCSSKVTSWGLKVLGSTSQIIAVMPKITINKNKIASENGLTASKF